MASKKTKPATAGEKIMVRYGYILGEVRRDAWLSKQARVIDAAIRRAVKKERERCMDWACSFAVCEQDLIALRNGIESGMPQLNTNHDER